jgi:hypothetical protein
LLASTITTKPDLPDSDSDSCLQSNNTSRDSMSTYAGSNALCAYTSSDTGACTNNNATRTDFGPLILDTCTVTVTTQLYSQQT